MTINLTAPLVLTQNLNTTGKTYVCQGIPEAFQFAVPGLRLYGAGLVVCNGAKPFSTHVKATIQGLTFQGGGESLIAGGSRENQTGGGSRIEDVLFYDCGSLWFSGMNHRGKRLTFNSMPDACISLGLPGLPLDKPDENSVNRLIVDGIKLFGCGKAWAPDADHGLITGGRDFSSDGIFRDIVATGCNGKIVYWDDGECDMVIDGLVAHDNPGRAIHHSGGKRNKYLRVVDIDSGLPSIFDDKLNPKVGQGGGMFHGLLHESDAMWSHPPYSGKPAGHYAWIRVQNTKAWFWDKAAFLLRKPHFREDFETEATWKGSYTADYQRLGSTPAPVPM